MDGNVAMGWFSGKTMLEAVVIRKISANWIDSLMDLVNFLGSTDHFL
jgi:hypothetical protein